MLSPGANKAGAWRRHICKGYNVDARPLARVTYKEEFKGTKGTQKIKAVGIAFSRHI